MSRVTAALGFFMNSPTPPEPVAQGSTRREEMREIQMHPHRNMEQLGVDLVERCELYDEPDHRHDDMDRRHDDSDRRRDEQDRRYEDIDHRRDEGDHRREEGDNRRDEVDSRPGDHDKRRDDGGKRRDDGDRRPDDLRRKPTDPQDRQRHDELDRRPVEPDRRSHGTRLQRPRNHRDADPRDIMGRNRQLEVALGEEIDARRQAEIRLRQTDTHWKQTMDYFHESKEKEMQSLIERANRQIAAGNESRNVRDEKIKDLEGQLAELKKSISSAGHVRKQVADDEVRDSMRRLGHEIQNVVVKRSRGLKLVREKEGISEPVLSAINTAIPEYWEMENPPKNGVCQAIIARQLMQIFEVEGFYGIPEDSPLAAIEKLNKYFEEHVPVHANDWRRQTMCLLDDMREKELAKGIEDASEILAVSINTILGEMLDKKEDAERLKGLRVIVGNAVKLAHLIRTQKTRFIITLPVVGPSPHIRLYMEPERMEDSHGEDSPELKDKKVLFAVLPAVFKPAVKRSTEPEDKEKSQNIVCKLRVFCEGE